MNPKTFLEYLFPLPPMKAQLVLREVKSRSIEVIQNYEKIISEMGALLPSILDRAFNSDL